MKSLILILIFTLSGCAAYWDAQDPCQRGSRGPDYQRPSWCGAGSSGTTYVTRDWHTNGVITTTRSSK